MDGGEMSAAGFGRTCEHEISKDRGNSIAQVLPGCTGF
jgi:hypothetical protein